MGEDFLDAKAWKSFLSHLSDEIFSSDTKWISKIQFPGEIEKIILKCFDIGKESGFLGGNNMKPFQTF